MSTNNDALKNAIMEYSVLCGSQESVINCTGYEVDSQGTVGWYVPGKRDLLHPQSMQIGSGAHPASWALFLEVKWPTHGDLTHPPR